MMEIHVEIVGLRIVKGQVVCALHAAADGFPKNGDKAIAQAKSPIASGYAVCDSPDVKEGLMLSRFSTTRIPTANWPPTLWECLVKAWELPIMQKAISAR
jgi:hypothetical protein